MSERVVPRASTARSGTLLLSASEVRELLSLKECIQAVEAGFRNQSAPGAIAAGILSAPASGGAFHVKTAGLSLERSYFAAKLNGNFYANRERFGLPRIQGLIVLCDARNGYPLAVMDSVEITVLRTGAATAVAARYLAHRDARVATICGCGIQGRVQLRALTCVRRLSKAFAVDQDRGAAERFADEMSRELKIEIEVSDLDATSAESDLWVMCTPSKRPLLGLEQVGPGSFIAAVGADSEEKQELEPALVAKATLVVDHLDQCAQIGELHHGIEQGVMSRDQVHAELHQIVVGERPGRTSEDEVVVFDSTGVAHQDVASAALVFERALEHGRGNSIRLLD